jgi:hypothetical protein
VFLFLLGFLLGCHGSILPFHSSWTSNGLLLRLIECIESIKTDVKKKMMLTGACDRHTKVTRDGLRRNFFSKWSDDQRLFAKTLRLLYRRIARSASKAGIARTSATSSITRGISTFLRGAHL